MLSRELMYNNLVKARFAFRLWQARRVVVTKDVISFALIDDDSEIDFVPLAEVTSVEEMHGMEDVESNQVPRRLRDLKFSPSSTMLMGSGLIEGNVEQRAENTSQLFVNAFQISTIPDGYNSGRSYYLQADSSHLKQHAIAQLRSLASSARKKAEARSYFRKTQDYVRAVYTARPFQIGASLLIVAVFFYF
jgi:hypothetical protein